MTNNIYKPSRSSDNICYLYNYSKKLYEAMKDVIVLQASLMPDQALKCLLLDFDQTNIGHVEFRSVNLAETIGVSTIMPYLYRYPGWFEKDINGLPKIQDVPKKAIADLWIEALLDVTYPNGKFPHCTTMLKINREGQTAAFYIGKEAQKSSMIKSLLKQALEISPYHRAWIDALIKSGLTITFRDIYTDESGQRKQLEQKQPRSISIYRFYEYLLKRRSEPDRTTETKTDFVARGRCLLIDFLKTDIRLNHWHQLQVYDMKLSGKKVRPTLRATRVCFEDVMITDFAPADEAYAQLQNLSPKLFKDWFESDADKYYNLDS